MTGRPRERLLLPFLIPIVALVVIGAALFLFSRVLLDLSHTGATVVALLVAAAIVAIAGYVSTRQTVSSGSLWSMAGAVLGVGMVIGGVALVVAPPHEDEGGEPFIAVITAPEGAAQSGFSVDELTGPADLSFTVELRNDDPVPHNFTVLESEGGATIAAGPDVTGPGLVANTQVPALAAGDYFFLCTLHPTTMTGTLTLTEGGGEGGATGPTVVAQDLSFDTDTIELPADTASTITFDNQETAVPHNIAIYTDDSASEALFQGNTFPGVATEIYDVPALAAGEYYFRCDVHPVMNGTVVVGAAGEPPPADEEPPPEE
jgi:plastocyanin